MISDTSQPVSPKLDVSEKGRTLIEAAITGTASDLHALVTAIQQGSADDRR
jgi:hypothetical protein